MLADTSANLVAALESLIPEEAGCQTVEIRRRDNAPADARFFFRDRSWLASPVGKETLERIAAHESVADLRAKGPAVSLRFTDEFIEELGDRIANARDAGLSTAHLLAGRRFVVGFAGPNTSKALHIGHLRNVSIGNALAAVMRAAGADVERGSLVGDIGRNICEAMAGYRLFHDGDDPAVLGRKHDHFIGECYARFIREHYTQGASAASGDPIERELANNGDLADRLMQGWLAGDPDTRLLWSTIREWVMQGHARTLSRFGVAIERHDFEADAMEDVPALMERGLALGVLDREADGTIVYRSGREEFETMILVRNDGFPTEHARLLGVYFRQLDERRDNETYIDLAGTEWHAASDMHMELMAKIHPERPNVRHVQLFHSMVTLRDAKVSSSDGEAVLIDDLLDQLVALPRIDALVDCAGGGIHRDAVASIVVKSFFLCRPHMKVMEFSWDLLVQPDNPGWTIAGAWCNAIAPDAGTGLETPDNDAAAALYRLLVIRSQEYFRNLEEAATEYNLAGLTSYLLHYCEEYLRMPQHPKVKRLVRPVLHRSMRALGLLEE
ncbi:MAG: arginine--tRNA ligase [Bacteroidetes bacterium]|nr:arginine--tRNA ligase [Bacteroidota bacterium]